MQMRVQLDAATPAPIGMVRGKGMVLINRLHAVVLESGIDGDNLIGSMTRESSFSLVPSKSMSPLA